MSHDLSSLELRLARLEAEHAVRKTLARYMALCDVPCVVGEPADLRALFTDDAIWEGLGPLYVKKFGRMEGVDAIFTMLTRYLPPTPHFAVNAHLLGAETIEVSADARHASGRWIMLQSSAYIDERVEGIVARLHIDFSLTDHGQWKISHFRTERLLNSPLNAGWHAGQS
jgi:hypothetical protein